VDADEFAPFFRREFPRLVLHLRTRGFGKLAEDAAEEAMTEAFKHWKDITTPSAWVRTVASRLATRADDREQRRPLAESAYAHQSAQPEMFTPETAALLGEEQCNVLLCLQDMPPTRRHVVALAFDGRGIREIAHELGMAEATVRSHLRHARRALGAPAEGPGGEA
jgi:RNA polymerase sigma-70 factor (ECF subfamily)